MQPVHPSAKLSHYASFEGIEVICVFDAQYALEVADPSEGVHRSGGLYR